MKPVSFTAAEVRPSILEQRRLAVSAKMEQKEDGTHRKQIAYIATDIA